MSPPMRRIVVTRTVQSNCIRRGGNSVPQNTLNHHETHHDFASGVSLLARRAERAVDGWVGGLSARRAGRRKGDLPWGGTVRLTLLLFACLHVTVPAAPPHSGESGETHASQAIDKAELRQEPPRANSHTNMVSAVADSRPPAAGRRLPLDVVLVKQRLDESLDDLEVRSSDPVRSRRQPEAGVELRCNSQAVTSTIWTLHEKSNTVREFDWEIIDETCLYELGGSPGENEGLLGP